MIVDVHTHLPSHFEAVPDDEALYNDVIRPDRPVRMHHGFEDYIRVMAPGRQGHRVRARAPSGPGGGKSLRSSAPASGKA